MKHVVEVLTLIPDIFAFENWLSAVMIHIMISTATDEANVFSWYMYDRLTGEYLSVYISSVLSKSNSFNENHPNRICRTNNNVYHNDNILYDVV